MVATRKIAAPYARCEQTKLAALVDPGGDAEKIKQEVAESGVTLMQILLTHGHLDHVGAAAELAQHLLTPDQ